MWWRHDGAEVTERLKALEVRVASLAAEVQSAVGRIEVWGAREVARQAAFEEATDKYYRTAERARKQRAAADRDGDPTSDDDDAAFYDAYYRRVGVPPAE